MSLLAALIVGIVTGGVNLTLNYNVNSTELSGVINSYGLSGEAVLCILRASAATNAPRSGRNAEAQRPPLI